MATCCAARGPTSTTRASCRRSCARATPSTCSPRTRRPASSTGSTRSATLAPDGAVTGVEVLREPVAVTVWQPDIGGLLPVYVKDRYPGFAVKTFVECSDEEVEAYVAANARAIAAIAARRRPDLALVNHLVMGPLAAARGLPPDVPYAVKVHGSDLEYAVAQAPERFVGAAREGIARAATLLVGSGHTARRMFELLDDPRPGGAHAPGPARRRHAGVSRRASSPRRRPTCGAIAERLLAGPRAADDGGTFARDEHAVARALLSLDLAAGPHVAYVGKLLRNKGVDLLAAAWPIVLAARPDAKLVVVGFGAFAESFDALVAALGRGRPRARCATCAPSTTCATSRAFLDARRCRRRLPRRRARAGRTASRGRGAWSTTSSRRCCRPAPRRSFPARSPRRSGWSPRRPRPPARCRSSPLTRASTRSRRRSRPACRPRLASYCASPSARRPSATSQTG